MLARCLLVALLCACAMANTGVDNTEYQELSSESSTIPAHVAAFNAEATTMEAQAEHLEAEATTIEAEAATLEAEATTIEALEQLEHHSESSGDVEQTTMSDNAHWTEASGAEPISLDGSGFQPVALEASGMEASGMEASGMEASGMEASGMDASGDEPLTSEFISGTGDDTVLVEGERVNLFDLAKSNAEVVLFQEAQTIHNNFASKQNQVSEITSDEIHTESTAAPEVVITRARRWAVNESEMAEMETETTVEASGEDFETTVVPEIEDEEAPRSRRATNETEESKKEETTTTVAATTKIATTTTVKPVVAKDETTNATCTAHATCYADNECGEKGRCLGIFVGKCNCNACINLLTCESDAACGGLTGSCNGTTSRCNCIEGYQSNGYPKFIDALRTLCNVKECGRDTDTCHGLPCNSGRCVC